MKKWMDQHERLVRFGVGFGGIAGVIGLGVGLSRSFRMDAQEKIDQLNSKNEQLLNEIDGLWNWIDAQTAAGAEFKKVDERFYIDGQDHSSRMEQRL